MLVIVVEVLGKHMMTEYLDPWGNGPSASARFSVYSLKILCRNPRIGTERFLSRNAALNLDTSWVCKQMGFKVNVKF